LRRLLAPKVKPATPASPPARLPTGGGYAAAALRNELDTLGRAVEGNRNNALNKAALCLGELVAGGELARGEVEQDLLDVALRIGLGEREAVATIKSGLDAGARNPRTAPEPERRPVSIYRDAPEEPEWMRAAPEAGYILGGDGEPMPTATGKPVKANKETPTLHFVSLRELLTTEWPEPLYIVKDMLPEGLTNVAGKSKLGKSWLCLQLGFAVAAGGVFLGQRVDAGPVCYAALEDSFPWLYDRAEKQRMREAIDAPLDFLDIDSIRDVRNGALLPVIRSGKYRLVVIDTLSRALTGDQNDTGDMTAALSTYQAAALAAHCAVIFVDHHNKLGSGVIADGADPDPLLNLLGATGKGAVADGIWGLYKQPAGRRGALLAITGRRVPEQRLTIVKDPITHVWQLDQSTQAAVNMTPERAEILAAVEELGAATSSEVAKHTGQNRGNAHKRLQDLVNLGLLTLDGKQYKLPIGGDDDDNN
jgi:predicted transcriptional regulator